MVCVACTEARLQIVKCPEHDMQLRMTTTCIILEEVDDWR